MKKIFLIIFVLVGYTVSAQQTLPCTQIGVNNLGGPNPYITGSCLEVSSDLHVNNKNVIMEADNRIHFGPGTNISPVQQGNLHASIRPNALQVAWLEPGSVGSVGKFEKLELGIKIPDDIQSQIFQFLNSNASAVDPTHPGLNPFNPEEVSVEAVFNTTVSNPLISFPVEKKIFGFWYRDFERPQFSNEYTEIETDFHFRIRFAPPLTGAWTCRIKMYINGVISYETSPFQFDVINNSNPGYVKVGNSKRFLVRGNNIFFPIGTNLPMISCHGQTCLLCDSTYYEPSNHPEEIDSNQFWEIPTRFYWIPPIEYDFYRHDLAAVASSGANTVRYMMSPWGNDFEFERLNNYDNIFYHDPNTGEVKSSYYRSQFSWEMDRYFDEAEQENLFIYLNVMWQYVFGIDNTVFDWDPNNVENYPDDMGYCYHTELNLQNKTDFLTNPDAIRYFKYKLRYIVARWGYSTAMFALQLNSEINGAFNVKADSLQPEHYEISQWHNIMLSYLKDSLQISQLTSVSYAGQPGRPNAETPYTDAYDRSFYLHDLDLPAYSMYQHLPTRAVEVFINRLHWFPANENDEFAPPYNSGDYENYSQNYMKPMINSEIGSMGPDDYSLVCDNKAEWIKNTYIIPFTGMAGMGIHWAPNFNYDLWQTYFPKIAAFLAPYNFNESSGNVKGWMPGHDYDETHSGSGLSRYGVSDLFYLRSPDNENAVGVVANRTYNFYTQWSCDGAVFPTVSDSLRFVSSGTDQDSTDDELYMQPRISDFSDEHINVKKLRGYPNKRYVIEYYNAWDPTVVIKTETKRNDNWNGLRLEFPATTGTNARPIVLFKIRPYKNKSSEQLDEEKQFKTDSLKSDFPFFIQEISVEKVGSIKVYPNPATNQITVAMPENTSTTTIQIFDFSGRLLIEKVSEENFILVNIESLNPGPYVLTVIYINENKHFKIIKQ